jgi:DNA-binding LacI/PurR family transcriptional regulator
MKPTMKDIAKLANVSEGTVSNVFNNRKGACSDTSEKILKIAQEVGYIHKKSSPAEPKNIKYIIFKKYGKALLKSAFYSELIEKIETECKKSNYQLIISSIIYSDLNTEDLNNTIKYENISGVIIQATEMAEQDMQILGNINVPVVIVDNYFRGLNYDYVTMSSLKGAYLATSFLIKKGHKKIGFLGSTIPIFNFGQRQKGFSEALYEFNIPENKEYQYFLQPTLEGAYNDMKVILNDKTRIMPTAFFAFNDNIALGAVKAMMEFGLSVPEQISVIGFDDIPFCEINHPRLTTIKAYNREIGRFAAKRLLEKIAQPDSIRTRIDIDINLIERESVINYK